MMKLRGLLAVAALLGLAACSTAPTKSGSGTTAAPPPAGTPSQYSCDYKALDNGGAFYKDDGPMSDIPANIDLIPEPVPRWEPLHKWANRPYTVLGLSFTPLAAPGNSVETGMGSWYGRKFHGQKTSIGESYNMFAMTAASPVLPLPSYARVTNVKNGRSVIVRVNDRGPFHKGRVMDLSFLAACRLGYATQGSAELKVESLLPPDAPTSVLAQAKQPVDAPLPFDGDPKPVPVANTAAGVYLQLAAFGSLANAESFRDRYAATLDGDSAKLVIQSSGAIHRVRIGPYPDRQAALAAAETLTGQHNLQAVIAR
ncbi:septal ring lytic transglycosylase RlpA family protein [Jeongeupia wiesaeckerbachi]|uniref:septal ring lytic transglycosylase RlpA family protein n=1 Tax=Jeongeupia wiesaeckerbachi TaxID=3051218 RepID=UPI003D80426C